MIPGAAEAIVNQLGRLALALAEGQIDYATRTLGVAQETFDLAEDKAAIGKALVHIERAQAALNDRFKRDG